MFRLPFNVEVAGRKSVYWQVEKVFITLNMITYTHFIVLVFEFEPNITYKCFKDNIINQVID